MKIKTLLSLALATLAVSFVACDDDMHRVGSDMKPDSDDIYTGIDSVVLTAKTISMEDAVYALTSSGLLGEYDDPTFGKVKSDFMSEFYCVDDLSFKDKFIAIDSVLFYTVFRGYRGDSINPAGISIYALNKPLEKNHYTNVDVTKYYSKSDLLGQTAYTIKALPRDAYGSRIIPMKVSNDLGVKFYDEWKRSKGTFANSESLKGFFPGIYSTSSMGSKSMIDVQTTVLSIHYQYWGLKVDGVTDSIHTSIFQLAVTPEVIQMNHVENDKAAIGELTKPDANKAFLKTPAGVYTEITIPLADIVDKAGRGRTINSAIFNLKGYTELEQQSGMERPQELLFVNKDSIHNFFTSNDGVRELNNFKTAFVMRRLSTEGSKTYNTYAFTSIFNGNPDDNIGALVNYYANYYKDAATIPDLKYLVIPISRALDSKSTSGGVTLVTTLSLYNLMSPASAILKTDPDNMKMKLIYSKFGDKGK